MAAIEQRLGTPGTSISTAAAENKEDKRLPLSEVGRSLNDAFGYPTERVKTGGTSIGRLTKLLGEYGIRAQEDLAAKEANIRESAPDYAQYLSTAVQRGQKSAAEAQDLFANFAQQYGVKGGYQTASQLGGLTMGTADESAVARYRPFQELAAKTLGISLSEEDIKGTEAAARALGKTSPEAFSEFLGKRMTASPEYIRKTPLAFTANLPFEGKYGVGYQTPEGTFTGTYRFKPPTTVNYS